MSNIRKILALFAIFASSLGLAYATDTASQLDSAKTQLSQLTTAADSVKTLYDIYDLSPTDSHRQILRTLFHVARRAGNEKVQLDAARRFATSYLSTDSISNRIESMLLELPQSRERDETILFMQVQRAILKATSLSQEERLQKIAQLIAEDNVSEEGEEDTQNDLENIRKLYTLVIYLTNEFNSSILPEYIDRLGEMMKGIKIYALRNQFYTQAANTYSAIGAYSKAIETDRRLLAIIDTLEKDREDEGRKFASYDRFRYICYRRMLGNYEALKKDEIEDLYSKIENLAERNKSLSYIFAKDDLTQAYYNMAIENYDKAIPAIKKQLTLQNSMGRRLRLLDMLRKAARTSGDQETLLQALRDYNTMLEKYNQENAAQKYRELQIKYEVHQLKADNDMLELEKRDSNLKLTQRIMWIVSVSLIIGIILLLVLFRYYRRAHLLSVKLSNTVENLEKERDSLKRMQADLINARNRAEASNRAKDEFLHSMSHEIRTPLNAILGFSQQIVRKLPEESRGKMDRYCDIIAQNAGQLEKIIDDVLYLSSLDLHQLDLKIETVTALRIMEDASAEIADKISPEVEFRLITTEDADTELRTDLKSANQVLSNLLSKAVKFTHDGFIELRCSVDREAKMLRFIVTDTGCGVPPEKKDEIFERFSKLNPFCPGVGLGLFISKQTAEMLGGTLYLDTTYPTETDTSGARFVFTLPI